MELDGDRRRPDMVDDEPEDAGIPGTNGDRGELHGGEGKLEEEIAEWETACSSWTTTNGLQRISGRSPGRVKVRGELGLCLGLF
jgi:hypothetical protein